MCRRRRPAAPATAARRMGLSLVTGEHTLQCEVRRRGLQQRGLAGLCGWMGAMAESVSALTRPGLPTSRSVWSFAAPVVSQELLIGVGDLLRH
jgi:hypothetical protein